VLRDGAVVPLTPKVLDLLLHLLDHAGELVTKEALLDAIWPDANVTDNALTQTVSELRQVLGDDAGAPRYIKTVARRGYRFIGTVTSNAEGAAAVGTVPRDNKGDSPQLTTIAVFDFTNVTGDEDTAWLSAGVAETVTADLRSLGDFRVIDCRRVRDAVGRLGNSLEAVARDVHAGLVVVGSFQRQGPRIRITARLVNVLSGEALADAKVDGPVDTIFELQDRIVVQLAAEMGLNVQRSDGSRIGARETESLDAFRAFTEGWLHLESLSVNELQQAVVDFEHAVTLDHRYALAHTGLASAKYALYETTRSENEPEADVLRAAIEHARHAVALDEGLAEAHAALAMTLVSDWETVEAVSEARRAVALEPTNWRHHFRLGHASWGDARIRAAETTLSHYPGFAFAHFQMAMLHVARGDVDRAEHILSEGSSVQDRQRGRRERYPALGLHWLRALLRLSADDVAGALERFDDELAVADVGRLYGREYTMLARYGRGMAFIRAARLDEAAHELGLALALYPDHAQSHLAMAQLHQRRKGYADEATLARAEKAMSVLDRSRPVEAAVVRAARHVVAGQLSDASQTLAAMLRTSPPGFAGWAIRVEPLFRDLIEDQSFAAVSQLLEARAA
jgi:DNA-binding winged helix-turn-helix (wHTH) protein/tetratricopeptide (TPR) repeat protein